MVNVILKSSNRFPQRRRENVLSYEEKQLGLMTRGKWGLYWKNRRFLLMQILEKYIRKWSVLHSLSDRSISLMIVIYHREDMAVQRVPRSRVIKHRQGSNQIKWLNSKQVLGNLYYID